MMIVIFANSVNYGYYQIFAYASHVTLQVQMSRSIMYLVPTL